MIKAQTKKWGNSLGIIIPSDVVKELNLKENEEIVLDIKKKRPTVLREMFGALPHTKSTEEMIRQARKELRSKHGL